jgi:MFS family permease
VIRVLASGLLTESPGWRWVFFVNLPVSAVVLIGAFRLLENDRRGAAVKDFDAIGAVLSTAGMLGLVYALVNAPHGSRAFRCTAATSPTSCPVSS